jgi:hypothetical protein
MANLHELLCLHLSIERYRRYPIGPTLLHYFALPRTMTDRFNYSACYNALLQRSPTFPPNMNHAATDAKIFQVRFMDIANKNDVYRLATKPDLSNEELEEFSYVVSPRWATLITIKNKLILEPKLMKNYRGLLPIGRAVRAYANKQNFPLGEEVWDGETWVKAETWCIKGSATLQDHLLLQKRTNAESDRTGVPTQAINNEWYIDGLKLRKIETTPVKVALDDDETEWVGNAQTVSSTLASHSM